MKQISSLEKVRFCDSYDYKELDKKTVLKGERFSYQIALKSDIQIALRVSVDSPLKEWIQLYNVKASVMDLPDYANNADENFITKTPGFMPDLLVPNESENNYIVCTTVVVPTIWVRVDIPAYLPAGSYDIKVQFTGVDDTFNNTEDTKVEFYDETMMTLEVLDAVLPQQKLIYTQWFYVDCIAQAHNVDIYSEKHWELIDNYMSVAADTGINMLLTPVFTPMLDTMHGIRRPVVQLIDIEKNGGQYSFNFDRLRRWISLCKKNGIKYFEISHMFSQWGSKYSPNLLATVDGEEQFIFGWNVLADSVEYTEFLKIFIPKLTAVLRDEQVESNSFFHISDEPTLDHLPFYQKAYNIIKPLIGKAQTIDALSNYEFYEKGLVEHPVAAIDHIDAFLEKKIPSLWAYYCCGQNNGVSNRFLAMPSYRNRVIGLQMYKYDITGFLQWGFNYYNARCSTYQINPYRTTSGDGIYPSGDPFTVYPGKDGALLSLRALVFYEGLQDIAVCRLLEQYIGKEQVVKMIEDKAGMSITFDKYPQNADFLLGLRDAFVEEIKKHLS